MLKFIKVFIKSMTHKKISYSYGGIDSLILDIFKNQKQGFYLDIGCGHPIKNNNTYLLNKKGWRGINIDLDEENIDLFNVCCFVKFVMFISLCVLMFLLCSFVRSVCSCCCWVGFFFVLVLLGLWVLLVLVVMLL